MIRINSLKIPPEYRQEDLSAAAAALLGLPEEDILSVRIARRSIEARKKEALCFVFSLVLSVRDEKKVRSFFRTRKGRSLQNRHSVTFIEKEQKYHFPYRRNSDLPQENKAPRPLIIGCGPAGLLCAYELANAGWNPVVIERGAAVEDRVRIVNTFWETGRLDPRCNVQFGEGGAGTFSDGKLNTGVRDRIGRSEEVLELFVRCGAPEEILYDARPHIGSDLLVPMVRNLREKIRSLGGEFLFNTEAEELQIKDGHVCGVRLSDNRIIPGSCVILAIGHSARNTFRMLYEKGVEMEAKAFAVGVRSEQDQEKINRNQWGPDYPRSLGAAPYKLTWKTSEGRGVYTFCMCPGGMVVNASSENGRLAVNGMSLSRRDSGRANSAVIVTVTPEDYSSFAKDGIPAELSGVAFQEEMEEKAFQAGGGAIPVQLFRDMKEHRITETLPEGCHKGAVQSADLHSVLPDYVVRSLIEGIEAFDRKIPGYADSLLYAVESRTSSPVRILRDETGQSNIRGLFPCGEGAGYAGGILSAAIDGIKIAEKAAESISGPLF